MVKRLKVIFSFESIYRRTQRKMHQCISRQCLSLNQNAEIELFHLPRIQITSYASEFWMNWVNIDFRCVGRKNPCLTKAWPALNSVSFSIDSRFSIRVLPRLPSSSLTFFPSRLLFSRFDWRWLKIWNLGLGQKLEPHHFQKRVECALKNIKLIRKWFNVFLLL